MRKEKTNGITGYCSDVYLALHDERDQEVKREASEKSGAIPFVIFFSPYNAGVSPHCSAFENLDCRSIQVLIFSIPIMKKWASGSLD